MQLINKYAKRKQKLDYLRGILIGRDSIFEILEAKRYLFIETKERGIYRLAGKGTLRPKEGDTRRYTLEEIEEIKKRPNTMVIHCEVG